MQSALICRRYTGAAMRNSGLQGAPTRSNGYRDLEPREAARTVDETTPPERLDEEIESLLLSLEGKPERVRAEAPDSARRRRRERRERRSARRLDHRPYLVNQFDLFFVVTAVVLAFAVTLLTVFLVNG
jgi:hypothetical protein